MSAGLVVCAACSREVHQDGPRQHDSERCRCPRDTGFCPATWTHCMDGTPRCAGATSAYPKQLDYIAGPYCGRDGIE